MKRIEEEKTNRRRRKLEVNIKGFKLREERYQEAYQERLDNKLKANGEKHKSRRKMGMPQNQYTDSS